MVLSHRTWYSISFSLIDKGSVAVSYRSTLLGDAGRLVCILLGLKIRYAYNNNISGLYTTPRIWDCKSQSRGV